MSPEISKPVGSRWEQVRASAKLIIESMDRNRRLLIVERPDGLFHILEEWLEYDSEDDFYSWTHPMHSLPGVYASVELAEREALTWPRYRRPESEQDS